MNELEKVNESKINSLTLIDDDRKQLIKRTAPYMAIPYMPITKDFIQRVILNDTEYPIVESKLSQAATEMKTRFNSIIDSEYNYQKALLEIEKLDLDIEEIKADEKMTEKRKNVTIREKQLEMSMKQYQAASIAANTDYVYKEYANWCHTVEDYIEIMKRIDPSVKSFEDVDYDAIRVAEISIKIERWAKMEENGVELTTSQKNLVDDYKFALAEHNKRLEQQKQDALKLKQ